MERLPAAVDLSAYRIVQEALTNTLRHAGASRAEVTVRSGPDGVELDVVDDGRGAAGAARRRRPGHRRDAGAGRDGRRHPGRRPAAGRRLPGPRAAAGGVGPVTIRVLLADDQALVRGGFRMILEARPDLEVVGEAGDGAEAVALVERLRPDVVLMDVRMPGMDGLEATRRIVAPAARPGSSC